MRDETSRRQGANGIRGYGPRAAGNGGCTGCKIGSEPCLNSEIENSSRGILKLTKAAMKTLGTLYQNHLLRFLASL